MHETRAGLRLREAQSYQKDEAPTKIKNLEIIN
jgi:hypothetical protein